ncbi:Pyruvate formate-lyase activating enzyme [Candidatus Syntrophocurvum alkaliphilum]|uniref:Pyruvate formate-lyase-activating enzyme n=1 Tax=Candidatus Syntrophocurvum alkaliphilum TaxID=2293317 RepID=A0A6I6DGM6_9FIRM|nr:pyruvate formate-lyase-activating protein [Candidatus Syntrophocurvum alkaliphilum]QGU00138.1 Pyruvate formate-lyase activating enzyme [Candidatus Syntrophocurvum alkaliphilum]
MTGKIHSIDSFSTLDGPGIRTVIFMQGCNLRCKYCHNPDSWDPKASSAKEYTVESLMEIIFKSKPFFEASGGGITFSGGEPLLQDDFIKEVFAECNNNNIHTAFDSSLYVSNKAVLNVLDNTDTVLADIKHIDTEKSKYLTGAKNNLNIENLEIINKRSIPIWIRYVVIPGHTDDIDDIKVMSEFLANLNSVERIDLLPYHTLGKHKWEVLGLRYELEEVDPPSNENLKQIQIIIKEITKKNVITQE